MLYATYQLQDDLTAMVRRAARWDGRATASARLNSSLFAAMPSGAFPGVDTLEVYEFLDARTPGTPA